MSHPAQKITKQTQSRPATAIARDRKVVKVRPYAYQPSKDELNADVILQATPEQLARAVLRDVTIKPEQ